MWLEIERKRLTYSCAESVNLGKNYITFSTLLCEKLNINENRLANISINKEERLIKFQFGTRGTFKGSKSKRYFTYGMPSELQEQLKGVLLPKKNRDYRI